MRDRRLLGYARRMRSEMTPAEQRLWHILRASKFAGVKFRRQVVLGPYIVDFASRAMKLVIEIDGDTHAGNEAYDAKRSAYLEGLGFRVVRFSNSDVAANFDGVIAAIAELVRPPLPDPLP